MQPDETPHHSEPLRPLMATPPTLAGPLFTRAPQSKWPMAVGVIAIVVGSLSMLMNACGAVTTAVMPMMFGKMQMPGMPTTMPAELMRIMPAALVVIGLRGVLGIVLLAIGIGIVQRKRWSARIVPPWSVLAILLCLVGAVVEYQAALRNMEIMANNPGMPMPMPQGVLARVLAAQSFFWFLARVSVPVFLLIWFGRRSIRDEVARWDDAKRPA